MEEPDLYAILHVPPTAGQEEIRRAYRRLARRHHPDLHKQHDAMEARKQASVMAAILYAYNVLSDPRRRAAYDRERNRSRSSQDPSGHTQPAGQGGQRIEVRVHHSSGGTSGFQDDAVWIFPVDSPLRPPPDVYERFLRHWFLR